MEKPKVKGKTKRVLEKTLSKASPPAARLWKRPKPTKAKSFGKGSKAMKAPKLTKANLEERGSLSLEEKMKMVTEEAEDEEQAAVLLKKKMTKLESSKVWSKHQTALKVGPEGAKQEFEALSKKDKGIAACAWHLEKEGKQYLSALKKVSVGDKFTSQDNWDSELQILQKFSKPELDLHIQSGTTWGVYEYKDTQNWSREVLKGRRNGQVGRNNYEPEEEDLEKFLELWTEDAHTLEVEDHSLGKGKGPGKGKGSGKGKDRGKGKGGQAALEDEESEEEDEGKVMKAIRTARNMGQEKANELGKVLGQLKTILAGKGKSMSLKDIKTKLKEVAGTIKAARDEKNELRGLAQKAFSATGNKASK